MTGILLALSYTALLLYFMRHMPFYARVPGLSFRWVAGFLLLRVAAGIALWAIYTYVYPDRATADIFKYFDDSAQMFKALPEKPVDYLRMLTGIGNDTPYFHERYYNDMNNWVRHYESNLYNDAHTIIRFNAFVRLFSFGEFHVHTVATAFLSLTGLLGLYHAFVRALPGRERLLAAAVFLVPSVVFWASGVIKESLLFFGIGLLVYQVDRALNGRIRAWDLALLAFNVVMLFFLKFYVLLSLLPALALFAWSRKMQRPPLWAKTVVLYGILITLGLNLHHFLPGWNILGILTMKQRDFIGLSLKMDAGSFVMPELLLPDVWLFAKQAPYALSIALLGPLIHASGGALGLFAAVENAAIILFLAVCVTYRRPWPSIDKTLLTTIVLYVLLLALVIGWTTPVMGAVVRYRTPLLPFLLIAGLLILDHTRLMARWPWLRRISAP
ncbi:MAG: hypothetical protein KF797_06460 [Flavobacteriales bacterium]|nr:hypothetical protein [Flavobacteriales bacterium]